MSRIAEARRVLALCVCGLGAIALGCGSNGHADFAAAVSALDTDGALYALYYHDDQAEQVGLTALVHGHGAETSCAELIPALEADQHTGSFSVLRLETNGTQPGRYQVARDIHGLQRSGPGSLASVALGATLDSERVFWFHAAAGTVEIREAARDAGSWNEGGMLVAELDVRFAANPVVLDKKKMVYSSADDSEQATCYCVDWLGERSSCKPEEADGNCCVSDGTATIPLTLELRAGQCGELCRLATPAGTLCEALQ